jgi:hypothetical protein
MLLRQILFKYLIILQPRYPYIISIDNNSEDNFSNNDHLMKLARELLKLRARVLML